MKQKKSSRQAFVFLILLVLVIALLVYISGGMKQEPASEVKQEQGKKIERLPAEAESLPLLSTEGYLKMNVTARATTVFMAAECMQIAASTTEEQAAAIERARLGETPIRPFTHELLADALQALSAEVLMVKVDDMRDGIYYSRLFIRDGNRLIALDSKPSDAITVAYRFSAPIYIKKELMERLGQKVC